MNTVILSDLMFISIIFLILALVGGMLWLYYLRQTVIALRDRNVQLTMQHENLQTRLLQLKVQTAGLLLIPESQQKQLFYSMPENEYNQ